MLTNNSKIIKKPYGLTLIELLLVTWVGALLISFLVEMYLAYIHSHHLQKNIIRLEASADKVMRLFQQKIHRAGYIGCARLTKDFPIIGYAQYPMSASHQLYGTEQRLTVHSLQEPTSLLLEDANLSTLYINRPTRFSAGDRVMLADCKHAEILAIENVVKLKKGGLITSRLPLHYPFQYGALVGHLVKEEFYIANTARKNKDGKWISALFVKVNDQYKNEIAENITDLTFHYSIAGKEADVSANQIRDWTKVIGISITFTVRANEFYKPFYTYVALKP